MNKKVEIDRDQLDIMHAVADGAKAMASSPTVEPDQSDDENIKDILKDLEKEEMRSPQFLNGVLISNNTYYRLLKVLEHANEDIKRGKRWEAIAMTGVNSGQAMVNGILNSLIGKTTDRLNDDLVDQYNK